MKKRIGKLIKESFSLNVIDKKYIILFSIVSKNIKEINKRNCQELKSYAHELLLTINEDLSFKDKNRNIIILREFEKVSKERINEIEKEYLERMNENGCEEMEHSDIESSVVDSSEEEIEVEEIKDVEDDDDYYYID